ncbi:MAG TPA: GcrA family cell cycle regulator [Rhabdaerophilum sp.]|nr:GcrA family cell cycle regulator [Rhabdaerophilum sp.]
MSWDDNRIEQLKKLWSEGLSASQIAAELGGVTRNAVIGKVHRLGLSGRTKAKPTAAARPRNKTVKTAVRTTTVSFRGNLAVVEMVDAVAVAEPVRESVVIPMSRRVSIMELREGVCRWPLGDPLQADFAYCGADCGAGKTYCEAHARIAFQPQNDRRRAG